MVAIGAVYDFEKKLEELALDNWLVTCTADNLARIARVTHRRCGDQRVIFRPYGEVPLLAWMHEHGSSCASTRGTRQCLFTFAPDGVKCVLERDHPVSPSYAWFTDCNGHVRPDKEGA